MTRQEFVRRSPASIEAIAHTCTQATKRVRVVLASLSAHSCSQSGAGTSRPAALPRISSRFGFVILFCFVRDYRLSHRSMRNRETDRQADRQTNDVWADDEYSEKERGGRKEREASLFRCKESIRTQYVLNQRRGVEDGGREGGARGRMGGWRAEKTGWRKGEEARSDSGSQSRYKRGKKRFLNDVQQYLHDMPTLMVLFVLLS